MSNLAHPEGNITGFHSFEPSMGGKWLELLKSMAPHVRRAAVVYHPNIAANFNMKTAKELGITIPPSVLVRADEVIE